MFLFIQTLYLLKKNTASFFKNNLASKTKLFNIYPAHDDKIVSHQLIKLGGTEGFVSKTTTIQENFQEAAEGEIYIDCNPAGESEEAIQAINIPLHSNLKDTSTKINAFQSIIHFFVFIIIAFVSVFGASSLYKTLIIDMINNTITDTDKRDYMSKTNFWIIIAFILTGLYSLVAGLKTDLSGGNIYLTYYGIFLISFTVFSTGVIQYLINYNTDFVKTNDKSIEILDTYKFDYVEQVRALLVHLKNILKNSIGEYYLWISLVITGLLFILGGALAMRDATMFSKWVTPLSLTAFFIMTPIMYLALNQNTNVATS